MCWDLIFHFLSIICNQNSKHLLVFKDSNYALIDVVDFISEEHSPSDETHFYFYLRLYYNFHVLRLLTNLEMDLFKQDCSMW